MRRFIPYLFTLLFLTASCTDHLKIEKNNDPQRYADSQFVGSWKIVAIRSDIPWDWDNNGTTETNIFATLSACEQDNLYTFVGDKTGTFKLNCSSIKEGSWQIIDLLYLQYIPLGFPMEQQKVISMTSVQFQTTTAVTLPNGQNANITRTWARQ